MCEEIARALTWQFSNLRRVVATVLVHAHIGQHGQTVPTLQAAHDERPHGICIFLVGNRPPSCELQDGSHGDHWNAEVDSESGQAKKRFELDEALDVTLQKGRKDGDVEGIVCDAETNKLSSQASKSNANQKEGLVTCERVDGMKHSSIHILAVEHAHESGSQDSISNSPARCAHPVARGIPLVIGGDEAVERDKDVVAEVVQDSLDTVVDAQPEHAELVHHGDHAACHSVGEVEERGPLLLILVVGLGSLPKHTHQLS